MDIREIDPNLRVPTVNESDVCFYDVRQAPFEVYGFYNYREESQFKRLPDEVAVPISPKMAELARYTTGGRVRFSTDSKYVAIRAIVPKIHRLSALPLSGSSGFDLYVDNPKTGDSRFYGILPPDRDATGDFESIVKFPTRELRHFTINFPYSNEVTSLYVGIQQDATLGEGMKYRDIEPIVFYGSSITQGTAASRSGNSYANMVSRRFCIDYLNLGFAGNGKAEDEVVDYMCTLPMSIFVSDYDHNASNAEYLRETHLKMYQKIRAAKPDVPYIILSKPDFLKNPSDNDKRRDVIVDTYRYARAQGDQNVYYIDGESIFRGTYEDCCTVDGTHPNDYGFVLMAEAISAEIRRILH